jgi:hypothetical protein
MKGTVETVRVTNMFRSEGQEDAQTSHRNKKHRSVLLVNSGTFLRKINRRKENMYLNLAGIISADTENVCMGAPKEVFGQRTTARNEKRLRKIISRSGRHVIL